MFLSMLCVMFIAMKMLGIITWSWWLVLAPMFVKIFFAFIFSIGERLGK